MFARSAILAALVAGLASAYSINVSAPVEKRDYSGVGTVYLQNGVAGSCGVVHSDYDLICALPEVFMDNEYDSPYCGRSVVITNVGSNDGVGGAGNSVTVTVADTCPGCSGDSVDLSVGAWNALTNSAPYGTIDIDWNFA